MAQKGVAVRVYGDWDGSKIKQAQKDVSVFGKQVDGFSGQIKKSFSGLGIAIGAAVAGAGVAVTKFVGDSISAASDLSESQSKVDAVFKNSAGAVNEWASNSAIAFGQSKQQALEAAGTYGNLFQAFGLSSQAAQEMSTTMVELAADLASFNNTSIDDAIQAIRSGLSGETEPLKRFGIALTDARLKQEALTQGIYDGNGALTAGQKAQAAYAVILQDTTLAQGDFARTSDGLANTQRILTAAVDNAKASIGEGLVLALQDAVAGAGGPQGLANAIENLGEEIGYAVRGVGTITNYIDDLSDGFNAAAKSIGLASDETDGFAAQLSRLLTRGPQEGLIVIFNALVDLGRESEAAANATAAMAQVMAGSVKPADHLASRLSDLAVSTDKATNAAQRYVEQTGVQLFQIQAANRTYRDAAVRSQRLAEEQDEVAEATGRVGSSASSTTQKVEKMRIKFSEVATGFGAAAVSIEGNSVKVSQALGTAFADRTEVFRQVVQTQVGIIQSATAELDSYAESVKNSVLGSLDFTTTDAEGNPLTPEQIVNTLFGDIANRQAAVKTLAESNIMTQLPEALANKILALPPDAAVALANYFSANPTQLEQLTANYNALATYTETALGVPMANTFATVGDESAVKMIEKARDRIGKAAENFKNYVKRQLSTTITVSVRYQAVNSLPGVSSGSINVTARANGGPAFAGMPTLVGERGPELIIPSVDSTVVRGEKTRQMMRGTGSSINLTVNAGMGTDGDQVGRQIVEAIKRFERTNGPVFAGA